jgi:N-carbamoyl-L-amino-acid hydrolase
MLFQFRDADPERLIVLERELTAIVADANAAGPCKVELTNLRKSIPARMDERFQAAFEGAAERVAPDGHTRMPSGAGHDAQVLARRIPAGMLFVPSIGGISHHWTENTSDEDIVRGARVFAEAAAAILAS